MTSVALFAAALSACNSSSDVLQPSTGTPQSTQSVPVQPDAATQTAAGAAPQPATGTAAQPAANAAVQPAAGAAASPADPARAAAALARTRLQIAPLVGASVESAAPLTERLNARARERGITLVGSTGASATHVLKGYFSALTEGKDTTVVYVWDVYDPSGNRLHRINGQQKAPSVGGAEGWAAVSPATMQAVADSTMDQLAQWLSGQA